MGKASGSYDARAARLELRAIADQLAAAGERARALGRSLEPSPVTKKTRVDGGPARSARLAHEVADTCAELVQAIRSRPRRATASAAASRRSTPDRASGALALLSREMEMLGSVVAGLRNIAASVERGVAVQHAVHADHIRRLAQSLESTGDGGRGPGHGRRGAAA